MRHLKRLLRLWNLIKCITRSPLDRVFKAVKDELVGSGKQLGYKLMWQRVKIKYGLNVKRVVILQMLHLLNSCGIQHWRAKWFQRHLYICPGPDFVWHLDGHNKLMPFGFAIHGCIDAYSSRLMWLKVGSSNNDPSIIAEYYLECIGNLEYTAQKIQCDLGTENSTLKNLHSFLANDNGACVIFGKSTANQRIEAWWSTLRKCVTNWYMNFFKDLREVNLYNNSNILHVECLKYCFMDVIQSDLKSFMTQ